MTRWAGETSAPQIISSTILNAAILPVRSIAVRGSIPSAFFILMAHGLLWFPLLFFFIGLAWTGWREYQKVEAYQKWAEAFDRAKYDIYSVLGQKADELTWGVPTRNGPINLETISLHTIASIQVQMNGQPIDLAEPPAKGRAELALLSRDGSTPILIPFTEPPLAAKWGAHLQREIQQLQPQS